MRRPGLVIFPALGVAALLMSSAALTACSSHIDAEQATAQRLIHMTNAVREAHRQPPLSVDTRLKTAAQVYATNMARAGWFEHQGPDGSTLVQRAEAAGYRGWAVLAENLASGQGEPDATEIVDRWLASPTHRRNLLSPELEDVGIACWSRGERFWCAQEFGARRP